MPATTFKITGSNRWCGPTAMSAVTGRTSDECAEVIQAGRGNKRPVKGVYSYDVIDGFRALGYKAVDLVLFRRNRPTFAEWIKNNAPGEGVTALVSVGYHLIVWHNGMVMDNGSWFERELKPLPSGHRRARVGWVVYPFGKASDHRASVYGLPVKVQAQIAALKCMIDGGFANPGHKAALTRLLRKHGVETDPKNNRAETLRVLDAKIAALQAKVDAGTAGPGHKAALTRMKARRATLK